MERKVKKGSGRQSNFELLRIISMLMIVSCHYAAHGVMREYVSVMSSAEKMSVWANGSLFQRAYTAFMLPGGKIGVAIFFMITGYFIIDKTEPGKIHKLIYQGLFYAFMGLLILIIAVLVGFEFQYTSKSSILNSLLSTFVITYSSWWFMNTYIFLMFIFPAVAGYFNKLTKKGQLTILSLSWILIYIANTYKNNPYYQLIQAMFFFLIGGYIRHHFSRNMSGLKKTLLVIIALLSWVGDAAVLYFIRYLTATGGASETILKGIEVLDYGLFVPICACATFMMFSALRVQSSIINTVAATTFGIYLLHDNSVVREILWSGILKVDTVQYSSAFMILLSLISIIGIFAVGSVVDYVRNLVFAPLAEKNWNAIAAFMKKDMLKQ